VFAFGLSLFLSVFIRTNLMDDPSMTKHLGIWHTTPGTGQEQHGQQILTEQGHLFRESHNIPDKNPPKNR
jgi:hypothetical protein